MKSLLLMNKLNSYKDLLELLYSLKSQTFIGIYIFNLNISFFKK